MSAEGIGAPVKRKDGPAPANGRGRISVARVSGRGVAPGPSARGCAFPRRSLGAARGAL